MVETRGIKRARELKERIPFTLGGTARASNSYYCTITYHRRARADPGISKSSSHQLGGLSCEIKVNSVKLSRWSMDLIYITCRHLPGSGH